ncbi:hypothetical protein CDD82_4724 [Ophiocordyceps australis]|uniref:GRIP domain-containing protein n=1 Tax=Ophiocordyceps australis TaxID=1399860 RepID=A0A2C5Z6T7_9HYPO|nr:hypothetical protein CDD82_4724 [Ophiocordyceps australis]
MSSTPATQPTQASSSASKRKANRKKKSTAKQRQAEPQTDKGDTQRDSDELNDTEQTESPLEADDSTEEHAAGNGSAPSPLHDKTPSARPPEEDSGDSDPAAKLDAMSKERESLRVEAERLRKQLENIQEAHQQEAAQLRSELEESNSAKEQAEEQYQNLLDRVEKIKESLSGRLKRDKAELEEARERIEELEQQNEELKESSQSTSEETEKLLQELQSATRELNALRSRNNLSAQNWLKEKEELTATVQRCKEELDVTTNAMGEWEVLAMEERSEKESLADRVQDFKDQVDSWQAMYREAAAQNESQTTLIENLQNALREIQDARKKELREMVESTDKQLHDQKQLLQEAEASRADALEAKEKLAKEVERTAPFEKEVREKNLLIGKLRHEAIVLNDHLTKALRYLKKTKPEDNVDRQVITNHLLHFLTLDRGDAKRFQVLQVMAGYLNWTDEQREQAGLARPGGSGSSLRLPLSPFHRTPSSPALSADIFSEPTSAKDRESLAELWAGFLERSAQEGSGDKSVPPSRKDSTSSAATGTGLGPSGTSSGT